MARLHRLKSVVRPYGWILLAIAALSVVSWSAWSIHRHLLITRLLKTDADNVLSDPALSHFARTEAVPMYQKFCLSCHGATLAGNPALGVPNLTDRDWLFGTGQVAEIERIVQYGIRSGNGKGWNQADMPAYASAVPYRRFAVDPLSPGDIRDTVEYLRTLEGRPADSAAALRGGTIFAGRGACYDCHGSDGRGDSVIGAPNLTDDIWLYGDGSRQSVFDSIARGHQGSCPAWIHRVLAWQARALAIFVRAAAQPSGNTP
jgi:cytochrome c oxidase cbb3-type subunit III